MESVRLMLSCNGSLLEIAQKFSGDRELVIVALRDSVYACEFTSKEIPDKSRYSHSAAVCKTYGTDRMESLHILENTLNIKTVAVTDVISCPANSSGKKRVINNVFRIVLLFLLKPADIL